MESFILFSKFVFSEGTWIKSGFNYVNHLADCAKKDDWYVPGSALFFLFTV